MSNLSKALKVIEETIKRSDRIYFVFDVTAQEFLFLNAAVEPVWQKTRAEISSRPSCLLDSIDQEDREFLSHSYHDILNGSRKRNLEFRINSTDSERKWLSMQAAAVEIETGKRAIAGFVEDITEVKEHTALLEKYAAKKDTVLEILSHDLANPLTTIKGASSMLHEQIKQYKDPALERMLDIIARTTERSIRLIREFVKQEFLESANSTFSKKRIDIVQRINNCISQYKDSEKEIAKVFNLDISSRQIFMAVDEYKFMQVINNLISNAIKFTPDGGTISVTIEDRVDNVLFTVADNGIGIPPQFHEGLFEKFNKARRPGLKGEPSVGLGMSLVKTIVDWHKGKIWFESKENDGTTFFIEMPKK